MWHPRTSLVRTSETSPVCLVHLVSLVYLVHLVGLVYLVDLVHLVYPVSLVQPNKQDKPNKPIKRDRPDRPNRPNEPDRLAKQPVPQAADFPPMAGRQVLVIPPVEGVASLYSDLYDRLYPISLKASRRSRPAHGVWEAGARGRSDDEEGEAELAKSAGHFALLAFNR